MTSPKRFKYGESEAYMPVAGEIMRFADKRPIAVHPIRRNGSFIAGYIEDALNVLGQRELREHQITERDFMSDDLRVYADETRIGVRNVGKYRERVPVFRRFITVPNNTYPPVRVIIDDFWNSGRTGSGAYIWVRATGGKKDDTLIVLDGDKSGFGDIVKEEQPVDRRGLPSHRDLDTYVRDTFPNAYELLENRGMGRYLWAPAGIKIGSDDFRKFFKKAGRATGESKTDDKAIIV